MIKNLNRAKSNGHLKPPLKWAGGKRWLVPYLQPLWEINSSRRLVEPFCGGLSVSLGLMPDRALLNDLNPHLINLFNKIKDGLTLEMHLENNRDLYYSYRKKFNNMILEGRHHSVEAAELFYYLNRTGYNGLCRFNRKGLFNVPFGRYKKINYRCDFKPYAEMFESWSFMAGDFEGIDVEEDDFIYADPPYDVEFTQYSGITFTWNDQVRLGKWLAGHRGPVVISNQATERVIDLYSGLGFKLRYLDGPRRISCNGERAPAKEVFAIKGMS